MTTSIETNTYSFTQSVHTERPYTNDPAREELYDAVDIPPAISVPLGETLSNAIHQPLIAIKASTHTLSQHPGFEKHAKCITSGITKIETVPLELQLHPTVALTRGEFRSNKDEALRDESTPLPEDEIIIVDGEKARIVRTAILDYANNALAPMSGFAQLALRNTAAPQEVIDSAQQIIVQSEQLHHDLLPLMYADVYVVMYDQGQRSIIPHTYEATTPSHT